MSDDVRKLPLWKSWVEANEGRLTYGAQFTSKELTEYLGLEKDSLQFGISIDHIRKHLRTSGKNFTSRGQRGHGYIIAQPGTNHVEMKRMENSALSSIREAVVLGTSTPLNLLSDEDRRIHESRTEKIATRLALLTRRNQKQIA